MHMLNIVNTVSLSFYPTSALSSHWNATIISAQCFLTCLLCLMEGTLDSWSASVALLSCSGSVLTLYLFFGPGERGDSGFGLFTGEHLCADGQLYWFKHMEQSGLTGRQTCCPKPTSNQLISLHSSLQHKT